MSNANRCVATARQGTPCRMAPLRGSRYCFTHDPLAATQRRAARRKGGAKTRVPNAGQPIPLATVEDVRRLVAQALADARMHENSLRRAAVVLRGAEVALRVQEAAEVERRLDRIEARLTTMEGRR